MTTIRVDNGARSSRFIYTFGKAGLWGLVWLACGIAIVAMLPPQITMGQPLWKVMLSRIVLALLLAAPLFAAPLADRQRESSGSVRWLAALAIAAAAYVPVLLFVHLLAPGFPAPILLISFAAGLIVILFPLVVGPRHIGKAAVLAAITFAALLGIGVALKDTSSWTISALTERVKGPETLVRAVPTALYTLKVTSYRGYADAKVAGGGLAALGDGYLAASGEGALFYMQRNDAGNLAVTRLKATVPINHSQFFAETTQTGTSLAENNRVAMAPTWFRVVDLLLEEKDGAMKLFAVHNFWKSAEKCSVLRISVLSAAVQDVVSDKLPATWESLYETKPCQPLTNEGQGGRLVRLPDGGLLLSVGVHDESNSPSAQDPQTHYGKTIRIDEATRASEVFTMGHRNPQGLTVASTGDVWQTEHGPRGGDELNLIVRGANFGWPQVSYGAPYFPNAPPFEGKNTGTHEGYDPPVFSWVPSIGVSNLIEVTSDLFPYWKHDLMVGSLVRNTLFRTRVVGQRVTYVEEIKLDERIRDLIQDPAGRLVLWTDKHSLIFIEPLDAATGGSEADDKLMTEVTVAKCLACHVTTDSTTNGIGPNLRGVVGRQVAGASGYQYSEALKQAGGVWDEKRLDKFLTNPQEFAPGVRVEMQPVPDVAERRRAINFLKSLN